MRNLAFREPLHIQTAYPPPQLWSQPHYLYSSGMFTTGSKRGLDDRCQMSCTMWTPHNNKSLWAQVGRRRRRNEGKETIQDVTADLGEAVTDLEKPAAASVDDTCSIINVIRAHNIHEQTVRREITSSQRINIEYILLIVNKPHETTKANNDLILLASVARVGKASCSLFLLLCSRAPQRCGLTGRAQRQSGWKQSIVYLVKVQSRVQQRAICQRGQTK